LMLVSCSFWADRSCTLSATPFCCLVTHVEQNPTQPLVLLINTRMFPVVILFTSCIC
jgi:hypothetical protein